MTNYNENGIMIKISHFIETVLLLICLSRHAKYTKNIIIHNYKYYRMLATMLFSLYELFKLKDCPKVSFNSVNPYSGSCTFDVFTKYFVLYQSCWYLSLGAFVQNIHFC